MSPRELLAVGNPRRVWLITGAHAVNEFYSVALPPVLPLLVADFNITYGQAGALLTVFYAMYSIFQLPAGYLADRFGQTRLLAAGMVVLAAGVFLAGVADTFLMLVTAQAIAGVGGSTYHPAGMSLISDLETGTTEGRAMGIHGFGGVAGTALAPALIGGIAVFFDWRTALMAAGGVGVTYALFFGYFFSTPRDNSPSTIPDGGDRPVQEGLGSNLRSLVNIPIAWWVAGLFLANLLISLEISATRTFATSYLFERAGDSTTIANSVFFVMLVGGGISSIGAGHLADRLNRKTLGFTILVLSGVALAATVLLPPSPILLTAWFFLLGLLIYAVLPAMNALTSSYSEREYSGSLFGVMLTAGSIGGAGGPLVFGLLAERFGMTIAFPMIAIVSLAGAIAFLLLYRV